jgi:tRNA pseudouridine38-40 synthase
MQRYKIKIEYEGTPFVGWQFQKNGQSVQEVLQKAIFNFSKENVVVTGAGRTDSGVHALGQIAHFDLKKKISKKKILPAINQNIGNKPVAVLKVNKATNKFHARYDAKKRTYLYLIVNRQSPLALQKNKAWHIRKKLNLLSMKKGSKFLLGTHDFSTYRASTCGAKSPIKTMEKILIKQNKDKITLQFTSRSFLQQQVRSMVGCIKYLGEGKWSLNDFKKSFKSKNRLKCAPPAPACGLYLTKIIY